MKEPGEHRSEALHVRVRAFIHACAEGRPQPESFDALACELARWQADAGSGLQRLLEARGLRPGELRLAGQIPAVPSDAFKLRRIACHGGGQDAAVFRTSGTTAGARGEHAMRTTATYELSALSWGRAMLVPDGSSPKVVAIAPSDAADSSLGFMLGCFGRAFGGGTTWLIEADSLRLERLREACAQAGQQGRPVLLAGASFAFVHLLETLGDERIQLPRGSRVMQTGGFKGRSREVDASELRASIASALGLELAMIAGEYGMTELSSQAYDGTVRAALGAGAPCGPAGVYFAPAWMRVEPVDPQTLEPVQGVGIARVLDLANVDSAVAVQTADLVRRVGEGFELLGRATGAPPRGCSLGIDELLGGR